MFEKGKVVEMKSSDILERQFERAGMRGYKAEQVDEFRQQVARYIDSINEENERLDRNSRILAEELEQYRDDAESIRDALVGAQKTSRLIEEEAKKNAEAVILEAAKEATELEHKARSTADTLMTDSKKMSEEMLEQAKERVESISKEALKKVNLELAAIKKQTEQESRKFDKLKNEVSVFRATLLRQYQKHVDIITNLPAVEDAKAEELAQQQAEAEQQQQKNEERIEIETQTVSTPVDPMEMAPLKSISAAEQRRNAQEIEQNINEKNQSEPVQPEDSTIEFSRSELIQVNDTEYNDDSEAMSTENDIAQKMIDNTGPIVKQEYTEKPLTAFPTTQPLKKDKKFASKFGELEFGKNNNR